MSVKDLKEETIMVGGTPRDEWYRSAFEPEIADFPKHPAQGYAAVFMEPEAYKDNWCGKTIGPFATKIFGAIYEYTQAGIYYGLVFVLGFILSFVWGLLFGIVNYMIVWVVQPNIKVVFMCLRVYASLVRASVRSLADPIFESWGQMFSFIRGRFSLTLKSAKTLPVVDYV